MVISTKTKFDHLLTINTKLSILIFLTPQILVFANLVPNFPFWSYRNFCIWQIFRT
jgi:hypothetical protein